MSCYLNPALGERARLVSCHIQWGALPFFNLPFKWKAKARGSMTQRFIELVDCRPYHICYMCEMMFMTLCKIR